MTEDSPSVDSVNAHDYSLRRGELSAFGRALNSSRTLRNLILLVGLVVSGLLLLTYFSLELSFSSRSWLLLVSVGSLILGLGLIWRFATKHFVEPDLAFRKWLQQVCDGNLDARIELPQHHRHFKELDFHTRNLASALDRLSEDMSSLVESQTERLKNRGRVLEMLLRLSEDVAAESDKPELLKTVCQHLSDWFGEATVAGYLRDENRLVLSTFAKSEVSVDRNSSNIQVMQSLTPPKQLDAVDSVKEIIWEEYGSDEQLVSVQVPFFRGVDIAGRVVVNLIDSESMDRTEFERVLLAVSEQLTLFNNKLAAREQVERNRLIGERTRLAADMHDSLAQTLLAARYKASLLEEEMNEAGRVSWSEAVHQITAALAEANQEIRELIREYRNPLEDHRSVDQIQQSIEQFRDTSDSQVFFQCDDPHMRFTPREELVVQRVIGEALTNAEKYADATTVRVYLRTVSNGTRAVLIEDDGRGFCAETMIGASKHTGVESGDHIGLSIMQERATSVGAILNIDSEPGEGTRVSLHLPPSIDLVTSTSPRY